MEKPSGGGKAQKGLPKEFKFWRTQPVPQLGDASEEGALEAAVPVEELRQEPYALPAGFGWDTVDVSDPEGLDELYQLLSANYVEDDDNMFRFDYSREFLRWALQPPGWKRVWHLCVRSTKAGKNGKKKMLAFISGVPATMRMRQHSQLLVEINFLCIHKKLRANRLAPVLIREITRRVNCEGIFQAVYTAGVVLPTPVAQCRYWHRSLSPKKLIDIRFSYLPQGTSLAKHIRKYKLPAATSTPGLRPFAPADVPKACALVRGHLERYALAPLFDEGDFAHWLLPVDRVVYSYVVEDARGNITDFLSFYELPSTVVQHPVHKLLRAAYSFYNVATSVPLTELMRDALTLAHAEGFDVFNALDLMQNQEFFEPLLFGAGDGNLQYYLYNYRLNEVPSSDIGLVLL